MPPRGVMAFVAPSWPLPSLESFQMCSSCSIDSRHDVNLKQLCDPLQRSTRHGWKHVQLPSCAVRKMNIRFVVKKNVFMFSCR